MAPCIGAAVKSIDFGRVGAEQIAFVRTGLRALDRCIAWLGSPMGVYEA